MRLEVYLNIGEVTTRKIVGRKRRNVVEVFKFLVFWDTFTKDSLS